MKTWKRRWFILTDNCLYYFEYTTVSGCCLGRRAGAGEGAGSGTERGPVAVGAQDTALGWAALGACAEGAGELES